MRVSPCSRKRIGECQFECKDLEKEKRKRKGGFLPSLFHGKTFAQSNSLKKRRRSKERGS